MEESSLEMKIAKALQNAQNLSDADLGEESDDNDQEVFEQPKLASLAEAAVGNLRFPV